MEQLVPKRPNLKQSYKKVELVSNHYDFSTDNINVHRFTASLHSEHQRDQEAIILTTLERMEEIVREEIGEFFITGGMVYSFKPLRGKESLILKDGESRVLSLTPNGSALKLGELAQARSGDKEETIRFLNVVMKKWMSQFGYFELGISGKFFKYDKSFGHVNDSLMVLQGCKITFDLYIGAKPKMQIDYCTRVISKENLWLSILREIQRGRGNVDYEKISTKKINSHHSFLQLAGANKIIRIHGIDLEKTAQSPSPVQGYRTYQEYYEKEFGKRLKYPDQYLVFRMKKREKGIKNGKKVFERIKEYYLPEFLVGTGLTNAQKNNYKIMNGVAKYTKLWPDARMEKIDQLGRMLGKSKYNPIGLNPDLNSNKVFGIEMKVPKIFMRKARGQRAAIMPKKGNFFMQHNYLDNHRVDRWTCIYEEDDDYCEEMVHLLIQSAKNNGFSLPTPDYVRMNYGDKPVEYKKAIKTASQNNSEFVVFILSDKTADKAYKALKKAAGKCCGLISQVIRMKDKYLGGRLRRGFGENVIRQIFSKLGKAPWEVEVPQVCRKDAEGLMIIGADVFHSRGKDSVAALVGTRNASFTKTSSFYRAQKMGQEIMKNISEMVIQAVEEYRNTMKQLPKKILFYRDGVGAGQVDSVKNLEIKLILDSLSKKYGAKKPKLTFVLVTKRINDRFFDVSNPRKITNPRNGLIVYDGVVKGTWEFFMVAQNVTQGTATPTRYQVLHDDMKIGADSLLNLTYSQTFTYFNWSGAVKVPGVCQYAHTSAYFQGQAYTDQNHPRLRLYPHYI